MNSVLQCLIHTPPLAELLLSDARLGSIAASASKNGFDPLGMTRELLRRSLGAAGKVAIVQPVQHAKSLKKVSKW
jgi:ubiquitin C-terminal hydrolase